jgi:Ni/Co efflux regulator RcnB
MQILVAGIVALALLAGGPSGKPSKRGKAKEGSAKKEKAVFEERQRVAFSSWYHGRGCPPGLAKKNNGCLPPGLARKRYAVGSRLPTTVKWDPVPDDLLYKLGPAPTGHRYVMVDGDLLTLAVGTSLVVDALSAIVD